MKRQTGHDLAFHSIRGSRGSFGDCGVYRILAALSILGSRLHHR